MTDSLNDPGFFFWSRGRFFFGSGGGGGALAVCVCFCVSLNISVSVFLSPYLILMGGDSDTHSNTHTPHTAGDPPPQGPKKNLPSAKKKPGLFKESVAAAAPLPPPPVTLNYGPTASPQSQVKIAHLGLQKETNFVNVLPSVRLSFRYAP